MALDKYFQDPSVEILASLYEAVNSMDCNYMPKFNAHEKAILRASENKDMFEEKFIPYENSKKRKHQNNNNNSNNDDHDESNINEFSIDAYMNNEDYMPVSDEEKERLERERLANLKKGTYIDLMPNLNKNKDRHFFETKVVYNGITLPIRVPLTVNPEEVGDVSNYIYLPYYSY